MSEIIPHIILQSVTDITGDTLFENIIQSCLHDMLYETINEIMNEIRINESRTADEYDQLLVEGYCNVYSFLFIIIIIIIILKTFNIYFIIN